MLSMPAMRALTAAAVRSGRRAAGRWSSVSVVAFALSAAAVALAIVLAIYG